MTQAVKEQRKRLHAKMRALLLAGLHNFISDDIPALIGIMDEDGYLVYINNFWEERLGWPLDRIRLEPFTAILHPDDLEGFELFKLQLSHGSAQDWSCNLLTKKGSFIKALFYGKLAPQHGYFFAVGLLITQ